MVYTGGMNDDVRITLRLPADLYKALIDAAERETRSLNGQIVHCLRQALRQPPPPPQDRREDDKRTD